MDKIKALMVKCGIKPELAGQICESINSYVEEREKAINASSEAKLNEAKKVFVEEAEAHQRELARRVQIFCEAKGVTIEQSIAKQTAIKEAAALTKLRDIQGLLEGVTPNGEPSGDLRAEVEKLQRRLQTANEDKNKAVTTLNRTNAIAAKVMKRNRLLESQLAARKPAPKAAPVAENKAPARLDASRNGGRAQTTRATLVESQNPRTPRPAQAARTGGDFSPDGIAAVMDADLV